MRDLVFSIALGAASGILGVLAYRFRLAWLGWIALAPLGTALYLYSPVDAGVAGVVCGALIVGPDRQLSRPAHPGARREEVLLAASLTLLWALVAAFGAWLWPHGIPAWGALIMPAAAMMLSVYHRFGVPRYVSWFLGSQDGALPVVHIARVGSDLVIPALLGLSASVPVILLVHLPPSTATVIAAVIAIVIVAGALTFGVASYRHAVEMVDREQPLRIAAVSVSPSKFDLTVPGYRDVEGTILRYEPHIRAAAADGARLIVLPEYAVVVSPENRDRWLAAISQWAKETNAKIVAGVIEQNRQKNQLVIADENGRIAAIYDKQHPAPGLEPKPERRTPPALLPDPVIPLSAVQCVDLDYPDLTRPVSRAGGVLAVPADDWTEIFDMHHRSAVWAAVTAGVPVVRSNGHGISAVYDAAGRVVAQSSSLDGPVVLVTNVRAARQPQSTNVAVSQAA